MSRPLPLAAPPETVPPRGRALAPLTREQAGVPRPWFGDRPWIPVAGILALALLLRLIGLTATALWGDEYGSIDEATTHLGLNPATLLYDLILRAVLTLGNSVVTMRLPSVIIGVGAVLAIYLLASALLDRRAGLVAALLLATSSYAIGYAQQVRFYSLFLCAGLLALHSAAVLVRDGPTRRRVAWFLVANLLCLASHGLGIVVVGCELVGLLYLTSPRERVARRMGTLAALAAAAGLLVMTPQVRAWGFHLLTRYTNANASYTQPRGLHAANLVKIAWTFFVFTFGERVYPLWLWLTVPGAILVAVLVVRGLWALRANRLALGIVLPQLVLVPVLLYLVFDAITATTLQGASPRYLIPVLGPFLILLAAGVASWRSGRAVLLCLLLVLGLNGAALAARWQNAWDYNGYMPPWPRVAALVARYAQPGTAILVDGRSVDPAHYYLGQIERQRRLTQLDLAPSALVTIGAPSRLIVIADTDRTATQATVNATLDALQTRYTVVDGLVRYPLFAYVLERVPGRASPPPRGAAGAGWQPIALPVDVYDLSLQDLALPESIRTLGGSATLAIRGALPLSPAPGQQSRTVALPSGMNGHVLLLATTLQDDARLPDGSPIAALTLSGGAGGAGGTASQTIIVRKGQQVDDWQRAGSGPRPLSATYSTGVTWTKLVDLVGQRAYPEAYRQFTAGIAVAALPLSGQRVRYLTVQYLAPSGILRLWAAAIR